MILRSAILGLSLATAIIVILIAIPQRTTEPRLSDLQEETQTEDDLPPLLFPMFPDFGDGFGIGSGIQNEDGQLVIVSKSPVEREVTSGSISAWQIEIENVSDKNLKDITVEERFDSNHLSIIDAQEGDISENKIKWEVESLPPGNVWFARVSAQVPGAVTPAPIETTTYVFGEQINDMPSTNRMATSTITIISMPTAGADYNWLISWIMAALCAVGIVGVMMKYRTS